MSKLQVGSLFSGIGGFDLGFERAGMEVVWQCEIDPKPSDVLERHWPDVLRMEDIRWVSGELMDHVDVLVGGFPCQDISAAGDRWGNREGIDGERSGLWWEYARVIKESQPDWVVIENTGRLRNGRAGSDLRAVVGELERLDYVGVGAILDAAAFGLPARRPRAFLVARRAGRDTWGVPDTQRLAERLLRHDPGCVVLEGAGQPLAADYGCARPTPGSFRLLSPREAERAMGFPEDWTAGHSNSARLKMLGNAVAVPVAEFVARGILGTYE